jgi:predicted nucleic-acid-binding Zn-ribbon protein
MQENEDWNTAPIEMKKITDPCQIFRTFVQDNITAMWEMASKLMRVERNIFLNYTCALGNLD